MPLASGTHLGPYEIVLQIGAGGMGEVYRARDTRLERDVAIKVLPERLAQNSQALARFVRETKAVAALSHPNLLAIFDTGAENGVSYAVTELLDGESLRVRLVRGPVPWRNAAEIGVALAEGIAAAHSKGITHRDLKPENIFLTGDGRVKVLDFGLARVEAARPGAEADTQTEAGMLLGTPGYMSPEQVRGIPAGPVSDIFSLGCVLYETVSGRRAFPGETAAETLSSILRDMPRELPASGAQVPPELDRLIFRCLEKNPEQRFQSARDLAFHFKAILSAPSAPTQSPRAIDSIAVLPFTNAGNDPDTEYLCDGISESIMNSLSRISQLRVTPRSTAFRYKEREVDPQIVGRELNVRVVLSGRVVQRGDNLVVSAELVDVSAGSRIWGERYHRKLSDIFALEEEIARKISESLRMKLSGEEENRLGKRFTENTEAYQLYLRGRHHWTRRTPDHVKKGVEYFQQAIEKDPSYALAYSGLADCYTILGVYSILPSKETLARAKAAAVAAVAFDDDLAEGHASLGFIRSYLDWDWSGGEREFQRALELNPGYWVTPYWYALLLTSCGRFEQAEQQIVRGMELEPLSPVVMHGAAWNSLASHRYAESVERCLKGLENDPHHFLLRVWLGMAYAAQAKYPEAIRELQMAVDLSSRGVSWVIGALGHAYAVAGNRPEALAILEDLLGRAERETIDFTSIAVIYAGLGDTDNALLYLEKACEARGMSGVLLKPDPRLDPLRSEPRFQKLLRQMNLAS
jgi:serine/threonine protein kinase/tetratricopeptide (TPR) repeat protein